jgi:hypothetical protein
MIRSEAWDVYLHSRKIDRVFYVPGMLADDVRRGLINHDGYDPAIIVRKEVNKRTT